MRTGGSTGGIFNAPPLARDSRFALASLSPPLAYKNTQKIPPVLQAREEEPLVNVSIMLVL